MNLEIREEELYIHYQTALFEGTGKTGKRPQRRYAGTYFTQ